MNILVENEKLVRRSLESSQIMYFGTLDLFVSKESCYFSILNFIYTKAQLFKSLWRIIWIFIILLSIFSASSAFAQAKLLNINHSNIDHNKYKITFVLNEPVEFKVTTSKEHDKIVINFPKSSFAVKKLPNNKLDKHFLQNLRKSKQDSQDLKITLELAPQTHLNNSYAIVREGRLFVTLELKNHSLELKKAKLEAPKQFVIIIDPGHGGLDSGTIGSQSNILEKNIVLSYAKELKRELSKYPQYKVIMTRELDKSLSKEMRQKKAREQKADIFISLHADSNSDARMHGASVYTLSNQAMDEESNALSERENKADILKNDQLLQQNQEVANVLIDMVYHDTKNSSMKLAECVAGELGKEIDMMHKYQRSAGFKVLKGVDIPAILIEIGYLSNLKEEKLLTSYIHKKIFARAMVQGISLYFLPPQK